jgi:Arc/MetJ family transcription regulator
MCIKGVTIKRTNIELDEEKIKELKKITGMKTSKAIIDYALKELIRKHNQHRILDLKGKIKWEGDLESMRMVKGL